MKFVPNRPYSDPEKAARKIVEIANSVEVVQDGRIHIEKINGPFLYIDRGSPTEYSAGLKLAIERGWLQMHDSGTYVKFTPAGADLFALWLLNVVRTSPYKGRIQPTRRLPRWLQCSSFVATFSRCAYFGTHDATAPNLPLGFSCS